MALSLALGTAHAQTVLTAWTCDAGLARATAGATVLYSAAAQGQPDAAMRDKANNVTLYPGFLGGAWLATNLDHDADGLCDEADADNDNDGLDDLEELSGSAFAPITPTDVNLADADGDGADDGTEAGMGSNPGDPNSLLRIAAIAATGTTVTVTWQARGGEDYALRWTTNAVPGDVFAPVGAPVVAAGGVAPWFDTTASLAVAVPATNRAVFKVERLP